MKQKDYLLIVVVVIITGVTSFIASNFLISSPKNRQEKVEVVGKITDEFVEPNPKYFNDQSVNPTRTIQIGDSQNPQPF